MAYVPFLHRHLLPATGTHAYATDTGAAAAAAAPAGAGGAGAGGAGAASSSSSFPSFPSRPSSSRAAASAASARGAGQEWVNEAFEITAEQISAGGGTTFKFDKPLTKVIECLSLYNHETSAPLLFHDALSPMPGERDYDINGSAASKVHIDEMGRYSDLHFGDFLFDALINAEVQSLVATLAPALVPALRPLKRPFVDYVIRHKSESAACSALVALMRR
jgi:hypothetical protein